MTDDADITSGRGLDRRSLLKKAAVGGAVVWVAPTLISGTAHAQGSSVAIISGFVFPNTQVELRSVLGSGSARAIEPVQATDQSDPSTGAYGFNVTPGHPYRIMGRCSGPTSPLTQVGYVPVTVAGQTYLVSCPA